jgi:thiol-disulfide isomerase/thioredoxin
MQILEYKRINQKNLMKKLSIGLLFALPLAGLAQQGFTVKMKLNGLGDKQVKVISTSNKFKADTLAADKNGVVVWSGKLDEPQLVRVEVLDTSLNLVIGKAVAPPPSLMFLLTNANIGVTGNAKEIFAATVSSKNEEVSAYEDFRKEDIPVTREIWALQKLQNEKMKAQDTSSTIAIKEEISMLRKKNQALKSKFIDEHPKAFASILVLQSMSLQLSANEMEQKFANLDDKHKGSDAAKALYAKIESNKRTAIGKPVIPFAQEGYNGEMVDMAALKGKVVIIDFWGSWCVPCRKSHPDLIALYEKYKSKGLEIVGVSNEDPSGRKSKEIRDQGWRKAIEEDGINWLHVLIDPEINDISKAYDVLGYPTKFLVDQEGRFVMRLVGNSPQTHEAMVKKIEELLSKK